MLATSIDKDAGIYYKARMTKSSFFEAANHQSLLVHKAVYFALSSIVLL